jgi:hypothetical protein
MVEVITIAKFGDITSANLAKQYLEGEAIKAFLTDETTIHYGWHLTTALGGVRLQVPEPLVEPARLALAAMETFTPLPSENLAEPESETDEDVRRLSWADRMVERIYRSAVFGYFFSYTLIPLQLYSLWLFIRLLVSGREVSPKRYWKILVSILFITPSLMLLSSLVLAFSYKR